MEPAGDAPRFVEWREQFISQQRGSRVVHYYLEDSSGDSHLAVVGTEKSVRHMLYLVSDDFCRRLPAPHNSGASVLKWRSRREVVGWLSSFLPTRIRASYESPKNDSAGILGAGVETDGIDDLGSHTRKHPDHLRRSVKECKTDITWYGAFWACGKVLRHYQAFCRNGITIPTHSFVLVMSEEEIHHIAYIEDMYEDKKGQKKVKVRWFHQKQEVLCPIPPPEPHLREVFITPYLQVISAECVDDLATVLTLEHYEKCVSILPFDSSSGIHLCFRKYSRNRFKPFDLTSLSGYFDQAVLSCLNICALSQDKRISLTKGHFRYLTNSLDMKVSSHAGRITSCRPAYHDLRYGSPARRPLLVKFTGPRQWLSLPYKIDQKVEFLCQDSGIRGCWFRCTVLQVSQKRLKVRYDDVENDDGCGKLEEWIPAFKPAAPDKLGMRYSGRLTVRPCLQDNYLPDNVVLHIGTPVDAWWNDGWWEGVVIGIDLCIDDSLQVYFPGEDVFLTCQNSDIRISREWVGNRWVSIDAKPDILSTISSVVGRGIKVESGGSSAMLDREIVTAAGAAAAAAASVVEDDKKPDALLENMKLAETPRRERVKSEKEGDDL